MNRSAIEFRPRLQRLQGGRRRREQSPRDRSDAEQDEQNRDQEDHPGADERSRLPFHDLQERGRRHRFEILARIDEVDDRNLHRVATIFPQSGGGSDELLDLLDLLVDRVRAGFVAQRSCERGSVDENRHRKSVDDVTGARRRDRLGGIFVIRRFLLLVRRVLRLFRIARGGLGFREIGLDARGRFAGRVLRTQFSS